MNVLTKIAFAFILAFMSGCTTINIYESREVGIESKITEIKITVRNVNNPYGVKPKQNN
jgi:hypothetical protein